MKKIKLYLEEFLVVLFVGIIVFLLLEFFWPRLVLAYINISFLLILWFASAIIYLLLNKKKYETK